MERSRSTAFIAASTLLGLALVAAGSWAVVDRGVERLLERSAVEAASDWASYLRASGVSPERLIERRVPQEAQLEAIARLSAIEDVFRWKLFDGDGALVFDSRHADALAAGRPPPLEARLEDTRSRDAFGWPRPYAARGDGADLPLRYAAASHGLVEDGKHVGFLEVFTDQTDEWADLRGQILSSAVVLALLTIAAVLVPVAGLVWQARRRKAADAAREHATTHDPLTGLLNRAAFTRRVEDWIHDRAMPSFHVILLDVRRFTAINDIHGNDVADGVLRMAASRIRQVAHGGTLVARLGGDEFAIAAPDGGDRDEALALASELTKELCLPQRVEGALVQLNADFGLAGSPRDGATAAELLRAGEQALRAAKSDDACTIRVFEPAMEAGRMRRLEIERRLDRAIGDGDFRLVYQPLYRLADGALVGFEALLRLDCPAGGQLAPAEFIPVAEDTRQIIPLTRLVLRRACEAAARWAEELSVAVNLSPVDFTREGPVEAVRQALAASGLAPGRLEVELTESALAADPDSVALQIDALKEMGVRIALDDFGTGYSSLSYVQKFPFDKLKIDRSFVSNLEASSDRSHQMLRMIVALGAVLGLEITAEGIETPQQVEQIRRMNIDCVQGFLFGPPMSEEDALRLIARGPQGSAISAVAGS